MGNCSAACGTDENQLSNNEALECSDQLWIISHKLTDPMANLPSASQSLRIRNQHLFEGQSSNTKERPSKERPTMATRNEAEGWMDISACDEDNSRLLKYIAELDKDFDMDVSLVSREQRSAVETPTATKKLLFHDELSLIVKA